MGVYPLTFAHLFLGEPAQVAAVAARSEAGRPQHRGLAGLPDGAVAAVTASMVGPTPRTASVTTDRGRFDLPDGFHHPRSATWTSGDRTETIEGDPTGSGLADEAVEVMRCLRSGETESPLVPLDETVALMRLMDDVRRQVGVTRGRQGFTRPWVGAVRPATPGRPRHRRQPVARRPGGQNDGGPSSRTSPVGW